MDINEIYQSSEALKAEDLQGREYTLTIKSVEVRQFDDNGFQKSKPCLSFVETEKTFVCNRTNTFTLAEWCGSDTDQWAGKKVIAFPTKTSFGSKMVDCIRFRAPTQNAPANYAAPEPQQAPASDMGNQIHDEIPF